MKRVLITKKMMWVVMMLLPSLVFSTVKAQDVLKLDLEKALEIALSENPTVKVADKEIEKKKYAQKGTYAALFPQINFTADYTRTLKKQVMYMDGFDMGGGSDEPTPGMEGIDMSKGIEVGRDNNCQRYIMEKPQHICPRRGTVYRAGPVIQNIDGKSG